MKRISRCIEKYDRQPQANPRRKSEVCHHWPSTSHRTSSGPSGWALWGSRSNLPVVSTGQGKSFWDAEHEQMHLRMAYLKKHIAEDPYGAIFGRRWESFDQMGKHGNVWPCSLRSFMTREQAAQPASMIDHPAKAHLQDFSFTKSTQASRNKLRYDPISGRMAPPPPPPSDDQVQAQASVPGTSAVIDCPPGSEVEAKFTSNPALGDYGQFQPESSANARHYPSLDPTLVNCPPGSELEALFTTKPASFKDAQAMPKEPNHKPDIDICCPPDNELKASLSSESVQTSQAQAETFQVQGLSKQLNADAGVNSCKTIECTPGSELEAMFISTPAACADRSRPPIEFEPHPLAIQASASVDCPPGAEIEAKFASLSVDQATKFQILRTNNESSDESSIDCFSNSGVEVKLGADLAGYRTKPTAATTVDCPPGSELEAKLLADPAAAEVGQYQPSTIVGQPDIKKTNITGDCQRGSELEALLVPDTTGANHGESEDLGDLQAKDIRARYATMSVGASADAHMDKSRPTQNSDIHGSEDRVGDYLRQAQKLEASEAKGSVAEYYILAYDTSTSQVTTAEAESYFGAEEAAQPTEVLARLHNPAKFVPYFAQMQKNGYEIATGGGDILVFRQARKGQKRAVYSHSTMEQKLDPMMHSQIAQYLRHDSCPADSTANASQVSRQ